MTLDYLTGSSVRTVLCIRGFQPRRGRRGFLLSQLKYRHFTVYTLQSTKRVRKKLKLIFYCFIIFIVLFYIFSEDFFQMHCFLSKVKAIFFY